MAQTKCNCMKCRRLIAIEQEKCPFCGTPNNYMKSKKTSTNNASEPASATRPVQRMQNISIEEMNSLITETEEQEVFPHSDSDGNSDEKIFINKIDDEEYEEYIPSEHEDTDEEDSEVKSSVDENEKTEKNFTETFQSSSKRKRISWTDEEDKEEPDYSKMYDENGHYNANFDGYYNDTLPKIKNEIDHVLAGREKAVLKVIFTIVAIIAIILYLILTI